MDLALIKKYTTGSPLKYNGTASFSIQIINQGNVAVRDIEITDLMPNGFELTPESASNGWSAQGNLLTYAGTNSLQAGASFSVDLSLKISQVLFLPF